MCVMIFFAVLFQFLNLNFLNLPVSFPKQEKKKARSLMRGEVGRIWEEMWEEKP